MPSRDTANEAPPVDPTNHKRVHEGANVTNNTETNIDTEDPDVEEDEGENKSPDQSDETMDGQVEPQVPASSAANATTIRLPHADRRSRAYCRAALRHGSAPLVRKAGNLSTATH